MACRVGNLVRSYDLWVKSPSMRHMIGVVARQVALLDAGCGEGMYVGRVQAMLQGAGKACTAHGVDVSKTAIRMAAKRHRAASFAVASSYILPFDNQARAKIFCCSKDLSYHHLLCF